MQPNLIRHSLRGGCLVPGSSHYRNFRVTFILILATLSCNQLFAKEHRGQPFADTTIINAYTPVSGHDDCNNQLIVRDGSEFHEGDTVLLIQMKGASIVETNTSAFGTVTSMGSAGVYEFNYVKRVIGNRVELRFEISRPFDYVNGRVQLIRVPFFENLSTTSVLTALPWDGEIGGVLVFNVRGTLTLNHDIDVSARGFRGGQAMTHPNFVCNYTDFVTLQSNGSVSARKGEGIYNTSTLLNGRGKLANGGGGGNSTNSGGAGGGNGGAGGSGGNQFVGCGTGTFVNGGIGGVALPYSTAANRIFMGGGGGAGHQNDQPALGSGGNGGGIVIISAGTIEANSFRIISEGGTPPHGTGTNDDGRSGGGAGGTILLQYSNVVGNITGSVKGGTGDFNTPPSGDLHGPGGGGGGGVLWVSQASVSPAINFDLTGGLNGTNVNINNNPLGATAGAVGATYTGLQLAYAQVPFQPNIDSVRINYVQTSCTDLNFAGFGYTNTVPIVGWDWDFGDGSTSNIQNPEHQYLNVGAYTVKLIVTDAAGCRDSIFRLINVSKMEASFTYVQDACDPYTVTFTGNALAANSLWDLGDGTVTGGQNVLTHTFTPGDFPVTFINTAPGCKDTSQQTITASVSWSDVVLTPDTSICYGTTKTLRAVAAADFCWSPLDQLTNANTNTPTTSALSNRVYYYTAKLTGPNLLQNADFESGNQGFASDYQYSATTGASPGSYTVGSNPEAWNAAFASCVDHSSGTGNMLLVNGSTTAGQVIWEQSVAVTPGSQYEFTSFLQKISAVEFPGIRLLVNGESVPLAGSLSNIACNWDELRANWFSAGSAVAELQLISLVDWADGNDFALDDLQFSSVRYYRDSVLIAVERPALQTNADSTVCYGTTAQLEVSGAATYIWSPAAPLNDATLANPIAILQNATQFIVEGTSLNGCTAKDTVNINVFAVPDISVSNDTSICRNSSVQLSATGGDIYQWSPAATIDDPNVANPFVSPLADTKYFVTVTDLNTCQFIDSVEVKIRPLPNFTIGGPTQTCAGDTVTLQAAGGDTYVWTPTTQISATDVSNPSVWPSSTTNYSVVITELLCNESTTLSTTINVLDPPTITASRSNDIDCTVPFSNLFATGAVQYEWAPAESLDNPNVRNPRAQPLSTTIYTVKGTDQSGCTGTDTVQVNVDRSNLSSYLMPNAFTPNGDGINDCFGIQYWGSVTKIEFSIYNRWGERVFYSTDPTACWNGMYKGVYQDAGVFVYMIRASTVCSDDVFRKGTFVLIR